MQVLQDGKMRWLVKLSAGYEEAPWSYSCIHISHSFPLNGEATVWVSQLHDGYKMLQLKLAQTFGFNFVELMFDFSIIWETNEPGPTLSDPSLELAQLVPSISIPNLE